MNRQKTIILTVVLGLIAAAASVLAHYHAHQKLGQPGVRTTPLPGSANVEVILPERVLDYTSEAVKQQQIVLDALPKDTSFGQRIYRSPDGFYIQMNVVLMGADRTSLHKPQICMPGQGLKIEKTEIVNVPIGQPQPYELPVIKLTVSKAVVTAPGGVVKGLFIYWFVADGAVSADVSALRRMWLSSKKLFLTGELQRWAYITCFASCAPGQEEAGFNRVKQFLAAAVPQFQTATGAEITSSAAGQAKP